MAPAGFAESTKTQAAAIKTLTSQLSEVAQKADETVARLTGELDAEKKSSSTLKRKFAAVEAAVAME